MGGMKNTQIGEFDVILAILILPNPSAYKPYKSCESCKPFKPYKT